MNLLFTSLVILATFLVGFFIGRFYKNRIKSDSKSEEINNKRRGIYERSFTVGDNPPESMTCQYEVRELEKTNNKSKIEVISLVPSRSSFSTDEFKAKLRNMIENSWVNSDQIEWIEDDKAETRNKKINELLK